MKVYIAQTPLILTATDGSQFRVETGEAVELTAEQYADVAAHVIAGEIRDEDLAEAMQMPSENPTEPEALAAMPSESEAAEMAEPANSEITDTAPKRGRKKAP